jgi:hypothetical protein
MCMRFSILHRIPEVDWVDFSDEYFYDVGHVSFT